jgi:hypothetical protein
MISSFADASLQTHDESLAVENESVSIERFSLLSSPSHSIATLHESSPRAPPKTELVEVHSDSVLESRQGPETILDPLHANSVSEVPNGGLVVVQDEASPKPNAVEPLLAQSSEPEVSAEAVRTVFYDDF